MPQVSAHDGRVEVLVLDNASDDATPEVVRKHAERSPSLYYVRHPNNIGSDRNIATSFNLAKGRYVWIMGDDDVPLEGTIDWLVDKLSAGAGYGLVYLRPYGFDHDFRAEYPGSSGKSYEYDSLARFLYRVGPHIALISAIVVNKSLIRDIDAQAFCGTNLVQVEIYLSAALRARGFLYGEPYRIAYKRLNTGGFDFSRVFVEHLGTILSRYCAAGLPAVAAAELDRAMLVRYFPYHAWKLRSSSDRDVAVDRARFRARYTRRTAYWLFVDPILTLPRPAALAWGAAAVLIGRILAGDLRRGVYFAFNRLKHHLQRYQRG